MSRNDRLPFAVQAVEDEGGVDARRILTMLKGQISDGLFAQIARLLGAEGEDFTGEPRPGGKITGMDHLPLSQRRLIAQRLLERDERQRKGFEERFPDAAKVRVLP